MPIAPWSILDIDPWKSEGIKFLPFHAYIRKMQSNAGCKHPEGQRCLNCKSLEQPSYKIKECKKHAPWPQGMCTECDPGTISLNGQPYRHTDHVEFESMQAVDNFIQFWRESGLQRCGYLYGKYVADKTIPLGIRAVVMAIYEPPQTNTKEEAVLEKNDPNAEKVEALASLLGMEMIGFIWTDLKADKKQARTVHLFGSDIIRIARMQNKHLSPCKQALGGKLGSKFVSVLVTTTEKGDVELKAYQVSDQCMGLVSAGLITYSKKDPTQMKAKKAPGTNYMADIIYRKVDQYGANVMGKADPNFPPEYFIISVRHGAPKDPKPFFKRNQFPIENRKPVQSLAMYKNQADKQILEALSDFHLMVYLSTQLDAKSLNSIAQYLIKKENETEVKTLLIDLLKSVKAPAPPPISNPPSRPVNRTGEVSKKDQDIINQLTAMGYSPTQAKEAVWATNGIGLEQALEFLLR